MNLFNLSVQLIGAVGIISSIISFQCRKHKSLMIFRTGNELLFAVQYIMLGAYTGAAMNLIGCLRNVIFARTVEKGKSTMMQRILFSVLFIIFSLITWTGLKSILIGIAKVVSTAAYGNKNVAIVRIMILFTSISWFIYNAMVGSIAGCICELFTICSIIVGIVRIDIKRKEV